MTILKHCTTPHSKIILTSFPILWRITNHTFASLKHCQYNQSLEKVTIFSNDDQSECIKSIKLGWRKKYRTEAFDLLFSLNRTTLINELKTVKAAPVEGDIMIRLTFYNLYMALFCCCFRSFQFIDQCYAIWRK